MKKYLWLLILLIPLTVQGQWLGNYAASDTIALPWLCVDSTVQLSPVAAESVILLRFRLPGGAATPVLVDSTMKTGTGLTDNDVDRGTGHYIFRMLAGTGSTQGIYFCEIRGWNFNEGTFNRRVYGLFKTYYWSVSGSYNETRVASTETTTTLLGNVNGSVNSVTSGVTVTTNNDKTGYSLSGTQTFNNTGTWTGNLTGSVGSLTTNNDKTGYALSAAGNNAIWDVDTTGRTAANSFGLLIGRRMAIGNGTTTRTLLLAAGGYVGIDWANIGSPTTAVNLSGTTVGTLTTNSDKTGYALSSAGNNALWDVDTTGRTTANSFGLLVGRRMTIGNATTSRTLLLTTGGHSGIDWANINAPTTSQTLSGTTIGTVTNFTNEPWSTAQRDSVLGRTDRTNDTTNAIYSRTDVATSTRIAQTDPLTNKKGSVGEALDILKRRSSWHSDNLVLNPDFEEDSVGSVPTYWTRVGSGTSTITASNKETGRYGADVFDNGASSENLYSAYFYVPKNSIIFYGGWFDWVSGAGMFLGLRNRVGTLLDTILVDGDIGKRAKYYWNNQADSFYLDLDANGTVGSPDEFIIDNIFVHVYTDTLNQTITAAGGADNTDTTRMRQAGFMRVYTVNGGSDSGYTKNPTTGTTLDSATIDRIIRNLFTGTGQYSVTLRGLDSANNTIIDCGIQIKYSGSGLVASTYNTRTNGQFTFKLDTATYKVAGTALGYTFTSINAGTDTMRILGNRTDTLYFAKFDPGTPANPNLCRLYGQVCGEDWAPIEGVTVDIRQNKTAKYQGYWVQTKGTVTTDANGRWFFDVIPNALMNPSDSKYIITVHLQEDKVKTFEVTAPQASSFLVQ